MGLVNFDEPMLALYNQGMVLGEDGEKMSKSRGNVIAPDHLVQQYGADTVRTYLMFFSKWDQGGPWNYDGIKGPQRLLNDIWEIALHEYDEGKVEKKERSRAATKNTSSDSEGHRRFGRAFHLIRRLRRLWNSVMFCNWLAKK